MKRLIRLLQLLVIGEFLVVSWLVINRLGDVQPPVPDLRGLDSLTRADLTAARAEAVHGDSASWRALAQALLGQGYYVEAEQCFRVSHELDPSNQESAYGLGFCLERVGRLDDAVQYLERASAMSEDELSQTCWYQIGRCHLRRDDVAAAEAAFRKAGEMPPARFQLAKILARDGRTAEAAELLDGMILELPPAHRILLLRADVAGAMGDATAAQLYRTRAECAPAGIALDYGMEFITLYRARYGLDRKLTGCVRLRSLGTPDLHATCLQSALQVIENERLPQYDSVYRAAAEAALALQDHRLALELLDRHDAQGEEVHPAALELRGDALRLSGDIAGAQAQWERAARLRPSSNLARKLADVLEAAGAEDGARAQRVRAAELAGIVAATEGRLSDAEEQLNMAIAGDGSRARALYWIGVLALSQDRKTEAAEALNRCLAADPDYEPARMLKPLCE